MLSSRQKAFINEYLKDKNALQAALRAGYAKSTAVKQAAIMLKYPEVKKEITRLIEKQMEDNEVTADRIIKELCTLAFYDPSEIKVTEAGKARALEMLGKHLNLFENKSLKEISDSMMALVVAHFQGK